MVKIEVVVVMKGEIVDNPAPGAKVLAAPEVGSKLWVDGSMIERGYFRVIEPEGWMRISLLAPTGKQEDTEPVRKE